MFELDPEERPLLDAVLADPDDETARLVYADWLEDRGDERAEYLRLDSMAGSPVPAEQRIARLVELAAELDPGWFALVLRCPRPVLGCERFRCPRQWDNLETTKDPTTRHCHECGRAVYFCRSRDESMLHMLTDDVVVTPEFVDPGPYTRPMVHYPYDDETIGLIREEVAERLGRERMRALVERRKRAERWTNPFTTNDDE